MVRNGHHNEREVFPETREQRCWWHKIGNVLNALPKSAQRGAKKPLAAITDDLVGRNGFFAGNDLLAVSPFYAGLALAIAGAHWLTGLPLVGTQILAVLLARSSSDKTHLILPT